MSEREMGEIILLIDCFFTAFEPKLKEHLSVPGVFHYFLFPQRGVAWFGVFFNAPEADTALESEKGAQPWPGGSYNLPLIQG